MRSRVLELIRKVAFKDVPELDDSAVLTGDVLDSLEIVDLIIVLEDEFGILFPDTAVQSIRTFGDIIKAIQDALAHK